jgi:glycyl-tRNA synthetase beta subunit
VRITRDQKEQYPVDAARLTEPAEQALEAASRSLPAPRTVDELFNQVVPLIPAISQFFDDVLVMAADPAVRANRLGLLQRIADLARGVADLSKLEGF